MLSNVKNAARAVRQIVRELKPDESMVEWVRMGKPVPPPHYFKRQIVREYATKFCLDTLVETGTFMGEMVDANKKRFKRIYSVELDPTLYKKAEARFHASRHITILHGDSFEVLPRLLGDMEHSCLFWLDGHYSGGITACGPLETPVVQEVTSILKHSNTKHVILIDDARLFDGTKDYPTLNDLQSLINQLRPGWQFQVADDIIRIHDKH